MFSCLQWTIDSNDDVGGTVFQGFKTGDFVKEKLGLGAGGGGCRVERLTCNDGQCARAWGKN